MLPLHPEVNKLEKIKTQYESELPGLLEEIRNKVSAQAPPAGKPSNPIMKSTYMNDYPDYSKDSSKQGFYGGKKADIVTTYSQPKKEPKKEEPLSKPEKKESPSSSSSSRSTGALKQVLYPSELISDFIQKAEPNTRVSIETCGILCGIKKDNIYLITRVFIPEQKGSCDMCVTLNYEEIQKYMSDNHLIVVGWIHTHPDYV